MHNHNDNLLINLSNHPYAQWDEKQKKAARLFGKCIDLPFPTVDPNGGEAYIQSLAQKYREHIHQLSSRTTGKVTVHIMGEMNFLYALLEMLKKDGMRCIASTSDRQSTYMGNGQKEALFTFVRFRDYFKTNQI